MRHLAYHSKEHKVKEGEKDVHHGGTETRRKTRSNAKPEFTVATEDTEGKVPEIAENRLARVRNRVGNGTFESAGHSEEPMPGSGQAKAYPTSERPALCGISFSLSKRAELAPGPSGHDSIPHGRCSESAGSHYCIVNLAIFPPGPTAQPALLEAKLTAL